MFKRIRFAEHFRFMIPAAIVLLASGCATLHVATDYSHSTDFAMYHTYSWLKVSAGNSLWADRIKRNVNAQLMMKGWMEVPTGGDAAVAAFGSTKQQHSLETFYDSFGPGFGGWGWWGWGGPWGWGGGAGVATTQVVNTPIGTLVVDIYNGKDKRMIWRGVASQVISGNPQKNKQKLENAVTKMFSNFPPKNLG